MSTNKPSQVRKSRRGTPRPNNPYGIPNEEFTRLSLESSRLYAGKCIAWSSNHDRVVASADDYEQLDGELERLGVDVHDVIFEFVEPFGLRILASRA